MKTINLRKFYGSVYKTDTFIELPDEIADALESEERIEHYSGQKIREHTYSIDYSPEIEYHFPNQEPSAEEILLAKEQKERMVLMSDTDDSFNFLIAMCYTQLFNLLCDQADDVYGGRLPVHVRCLIDECANIGQIPKLEKLMATIRSREISACLILQTQSQLKALYKDNAETVIGNCDASLFLGGKEPTTLKALSEALGRETIDTYNTGESRGRETSHSLNYQKLGKSLLSVDELEVLDGGKCILQLRGVRPFLSDKYDITRHPNYKYLSDANPRNAFDIEKYLSTRLVPKADEVYEVFDAGRV